MERMVRPGRMIWLRQERRGRHQEEKALEEKALGCCEVVLLSIAVSLP
jgi:hypothetical protein